MVDATPPNLGTISVQFVNYLRSTEEDIMVTWTGFSDPESGIASYEIGIGSSNTNQDVMLFEAAQGEVSLIKAKELLSDGKVYYFHVKVGTTALINSLYW